MAEQNPQQEPSMEEILASIRRIISEDGDEAAEKDDAPAAEAQPAPAAEAAPEPEPEPEPEPPSAEPEPPAPEPVALEEDDDVLELTDEVQDDGTVVNLKTGDEVDEAADEAADEDVELEMVDAVEEEPEPEPEPESAPEPEPVEAVAAAAATAFVEDDRLISDRPASDSVNSLAALAAAMDTHRRATDPSIGSRTIEDLVKEVMRPMIREWLDAHLPSLVERLVTREIERLTRDAEDYSQR